MKPVGELIEEKLNLIIPIKSSVITSTAKIITTMVDNTFLKKDFISYFLGLVKISNF